MAAIQKVGLRGPGPGSVKRGCRTGSVTSECGQGDKTFVPSCFHILSVYQFFPLAPRDLKPGW